MARTILALAFGILILPSSFGQTLAVVSHSTNAGGSRSMMVDLETGILDILFSEGLIATTMSASESSGSLDLPRLLGDAREGLVEWILLVDASYDAAANANSLPARLACTLYRVADGRSVILDYPTIPTPRGTDPADVSRSLRLLGASVAKEALVVLRSPQAHFGLSGGLTAVHGGS
jgi:hypothetical protein